MNRPVGGGFNWGRVGHGETSSQRRELGECTAICHLVRIPAAQQRQNGNTPLSRGQDIRFLGVMMSPIAISLITILARGVKRWRCVRVGRK